MYLCICMNVSQNTTQTQPCIIYFCLRSRDISVTYYPTVLHKSQGHSFWSLRDHHGSLVSHKGWVSLFITRVVSSVTPKLFQSLLWIFWAWWCHFRIVITIFCLANTDESYGLKVVPYRPPFVHHRLKYKSFHSCLHGFKNSLDEMPNVILAK